MLKISDITKFTLQDFPNRTACIIWFAGCNMRCQYCHNVELLEQQDNFLSEECVLNFLNERKNLLDGVVLSGGECSLGGDEVVDFIKKIKNMGFKIKIDTNGLNYDFVETLIENKLIDYIALDFKAPKEKFDIITATKNKFDIYMKTLKLIIMSKIEKEIRTTVHVDLLNEDDINCIINILEKNHFNDTFYIQKFKNNNNRVLNSLLAPSRDININKIKKTNIFNIEYRNF